MGGALFGGLETALSALEAQQAVLATTAHNVANVNTPGYAQEHVNLVPVPGGAAGLDQGGTPQPGNGVQVADIQRVVSHFLNQQNWTNSGQLAAASQDSTTLGQVQAVLNEPTASGLRNTLDAFWSAWQNLGNHPGSEAARQQVISAGQALANGFATISSSWGQLQQSLNASVGQGVLQVQRLAGQIATLNGQIAEQQSAGQGANNLKDQRDQLISQLSQLVPVGVTQEQDGVVNIAAGSVQLVAGTQVEPLVATANTANHGFYALTWGSASGPSAHFGSQGGTLGALIHLRDTVVPGYSSGLDQLAGQVAGAVNTQHKAGASLDGTVTGMAFFVPSSGTTLGASNLQVNATLVANPQDLAAAAVPFQGPGDGSNAQAIGDLMNSPIAGGTTADGAYAALVGQIGSDAAAATASQSNLQALRSNLQQQIQSVSGVSINEQMTYMVQAQNAYAAAAKVTATIDQMLGDLMNMVQ